MWFTCGEIGNHWLVNQKGRLSGLPVDQISVEVSVEVSVEIGIKQQQTIKKNKSVWPIGADSKKKTLKVRSLKSQTKALSL